MEKAKIIISGGDGFIGSNIIKQFHKKYDFIVLKRRGSSIHYAEIGKLATIQVEPEIGNKVILEFSDAIGMILLSASRPNPASSGLIRDVFDMDIISFQDKINNNSNISIICFRTFWIC